MGPGRPLTLPVALAVLYATIGCLLAAGAVAGWIVAEVLDERNRRRNSRPGAGRIGRRAHGLPSAARVHVLPDEGSPPEGDRACLPGLRPAGRAVPPSTRGD